MAKGSVRVAFETARLRLAEIRGDGQQARLSAYRAACQQSAKTLDVPRVSVWFLTRARDGIQCALTYDRGSDSFTSGGELLRTDCPRYFDAILSRRVVAAANALTDDSTRELTDYLTRFEVGALLDAPIFRDGAVIGVVCHESQTGPREWTEREADFASAVADLLTILLQQSERAELRAAVDAQLQLQAEHRKLEALLRLGRVAAHDLANVLTIAAARAEELDSLHPDLPDEDKVAEVIAYGGKLLQQLRDFCDSRVPQGEVVVTAALASLVTSLRTLLGKHIDLDVQGDVGDTVLPIAPVEFEQMMLNLCMNAKDAIDGTGKVTLRATLEDGSVVLSVSDTGRGMDEATQERLFEPYYSTKAGHTGVGLSAVYGIVDRANGRIEVRSQPGQGSTFRIELPLAPPQSDFDQPWSF
jgi:signal transduction histidine kinase